MVDVRKSVKIFIFIFWVSKISEDYSVSAWRFGLNRRRIAIIPLELSVKECDSLGIMKFQHCSDEA